MVESSRSEPTKKIRLSQEDFSTFENTLCQELSKFEGLFGLMATSHAEITDGGKGTKPVLYQVGELGQMLTDRLWSKMLDLFEARG